MTESLHDLDAQIHAALAPVLLRHGIDLTDWVIMLDGIDLKEGESTAHALHSPACNAFKRAGMITLLPSCWSTPLVVYEDEGDD